MPEDELDPDDAAVTPASVDDDDVADDAEDDGPRLSELVALEEAAPDDDESLVTARVADMEARGQRIHDGKPDAQDPLGQASTVERVRQRSAAGAMGMALGLAFDQVFGKDHKKEAAIVLEVPGEPYGDDDPVVVAYANEDAEGTTVSIRPWLLKKKPEPGAEDDA